MNHDTTPTPRAWRALYGVLWRMLFNAYNVLVGRMNATDTNSSACPEYWVCELLDHLQNEQYMYFNRSCQTQHERSRYVNTCLEVIEFVYRYSERKFNYGDLLAELYAGWLDEFTYDEDFGLIDDEPIIVPFPFFAFDTQEVSRCRTQPICRHDYQHARGVLFWHPSALDYEAEIEEIKKRKIDKKEV